MKRVKKLALALVSVGLLVRALAPAGRGLGARSQPSPPPLGSGLWSASPVAAAPSFAARVTTTKLDDAADHRAAPPLNLTVTLKGCNAARCLLGLSLRYMGEKEISIYQWELPWETSHSILLLAVKSNGEVLDRDFGPEDPVFSRSPLLKPGDALHGEIELYGQFRGLAEALREREINLFWSYQLKPNGAKDPLPRVGGWLLLPKQTP